MPALGWPRCWSQQNFKEASIPLLHEVVVHTLEMNGKIKVHSKKKKNKKETIKKNQIEYVKL